MIGDTLSHYLVKEQIGAGGMGVVYLARDQRLEREVAIKVLPPGTLTNESLRKRFRNEALTLSKLNHPNIATIYDFDSEGQTDFLVTEYISGTTLDAKLSGGPLPWKEVVHLGIELAEGLAAAHAQGIVHRDLKPANLRLTADGRLKILDFGLAQFVMPDADLAQTISLTSSQQITGTLPYMAPEQLRGEPIDARSDIWAAGAVLYELATAKRPFREGNGPLLIDAILNRSPEPPSVANPEINPGLEHIIVKALQKNPLERYQTSRDFAADLERLTTGFKPLATPSRKQPFLWMTLAGIVVLLVVGLAVYFYRVSRFAPGSATTTAATLTVRRSVAVLGFKNLSGRSETAWLSTALAEMLTTELAAGEQLLTVSGESVARVKNDLSLPETDTLAADTLGRVRNNLGADFVVLGSYLDLGNGKPEDQIRLDMRIQDATQGQTIAAVSEKGTLAELDGLVTRAGNQLRQKLGVGDMAPTEQLAAKATMPSNLTAARLYSEGLMRLRAWDELGARDLLLKAVEADPNHAPSHAALAAAWNSSGYDAKAAASAKRAFDLSGDLPRDERLRVEALYYESDKQWDRAAAIYRQLFESEPDNLEFGLDLARALTTAGKPAETLKTIAVLRKLPSPYKDDLRIDLAEGRAAHYLSDFQRERDIARAAADKGDRQGARFVVAAARQSECSALRNLGDAKGAISACEAAQRVYISSGDRYGIAIALNSIGNALYDLGNLEEAKKTYEEALKLNRDIGNDRGIAGALDNIASVVGDQGDSATARKLSEQALAIYRTTGDKINVAATLNNIAAELLVLGDLTASEKAFEESLAIAREIHSDTSIGTALTNICDLQLALGNPEAARKAAVEAYDIFQRTGEKSKSANPLIGLGNVQLLTGDLKAARSTFDQALGIAREAGDKHLTAVALSGLGKILLWQDDLPGARAKVAEAMAIREEIGEKDGISDSQLDMARIDIEEGHADIATAGLRKVITDSHTQKLLEREATARAVLATNLANSRSKEALQEIAAAKAVAKHVQRRENTFDVRLADAKIMAVAKPSSPQAARAALQALAEEASRIGFRSYEFEARLALGQLEQGSGNKAQAQLDALAKEARESGFLRIASKAKNPVQ